MYMLTETIIKGISYLSLWRCWPSVCQPLLQGGLADFHDYFNFIVTSTTQRIFCLLLYNLEFHGNPDMEAVPILLQHFPNSGPSPHVNFLSCCDSSDSTGAASPSTAWLCEKHFVQQPQSMNYNYGQLVFFHQLRIHFHSILLFSLKPRHFILFFVVSCTMILKFSRHK